MQHGNERKKYFIHYKYQAYEKINNMFTSNSEKSCLNDTINNFKDLKTSINNGYIEYKCQNDLYYDTFTESKKILEKKFLQDYYISHEHIKEMVSNCTKEKFEEYKDCPRSIIKLYDLRKEHQG